MSETDWIRASAWVALVLWAWGEVLLAREPGTGRAGRTPVSARVWAAGAAVLAVHMVAAYGLRHHWSHAAAVVETARQTEAVFGLRWGGGVWVNYALLGVWTFDAVRVWRRGCRGGPPGAWVLVRAAVFTFLWFQGAVVFGHGAGRVLGLAACAAVVAAWGLRWRRTAGSRP